jgi:hypothetical protein
MRQTAAPAPLRFWIWRLGKVSWSFGHHGRANSASAKKPRVPIIGIAALLDFKDARENA